MIYEMMIYNEKMCVKGCDDMICDKKCVCVHIRIWKQKMHVQIESVELLSPCRIKTCNSYWYLSEHFKN